MTTIVEYLAPLKKASGRDQILTAMYYAEQFEGISTFVVEDIRQLLRRARVQGAVGKDLHTPLARAGALAYSPGTSGGRKQWQLTETGRNHVRSLLGLPEGAKETEHEVGTLVRLVGQISDPDVQGYVSEALDCLRFDALRACAVFLWAGAARSIQQEMLKHCLPAVNAALTKHDKGARQIRTIDDFAYVKESIQLLAAEELGLFDKNQRQMLGQALDLRNKCGHPGKYDPGPKKVAAFIEDILKIVFGAS